MKKRPAEFGYYFMFGGFATLIDWGVYALCFHGFGLQYLTALAFSMGGAGCFHYFANKYITFQCNSRELHLQVPVYIAVAFAGFALSAGLMWVEVKGAGLHALIARPLTTVLMLLPNYCMHKYITFSKKIFI